MVDFFLALFYRTEDTLADLRSSLIGNVRVDVSPNLLKLSGSLGKLALGHNATTVDHVDLIRAIALLEDRIGPEVLDAKVVVLEIGVVIETEATPATYLNLLAKANQKRRFEYGATTVSFGNKNSRIVFYDKIEEMRAKRVEIPAELEGRNQLRVEWRLRRRIRRQVGRELILKDLANPVILAGLIRHFQKVYDQVIKPARALHVGAAGQLTAKLALDELFAFYLYEDGAQAVDARLRSFRKRMPGFHYDRLRDRVMSIYGRQPEHIVQLKDELDFKINEQCAKVLLSCLTPIKEKS